MKISFLNTIETKAAVNYRQRDSQMRGQACGDFMKKNGITGSEKLRRNYIEMLRRRARELHQFASRCQEGRLTTAEIDEVHLRVHSLVGSGATYGYPDISDSAYKFDRALDRPTSAGLPKLGGLAGCLEETCKTALDAAEEASAGPSFDALPPEQGGPRPVLLAVDDDPAIHDLVNSMFRDSAQIVTAYSGDEAIEALRRHCPDLILLDHYMPGMNGLKLLENINDDRNMPPIPVIMLTATSGPEDIMRAAAMGAADYIAKPFDPQILADKMSELMRRIRMTVLVASENTAMRRLVADRLRRTGLNVIEASGGKNALARAQKFVPELILLDRSSPGTDDGETLRALRADKRTRHIPTLDIAADAPNHATPEKITTHVMNALGLDLPWM